MRLVGCHLTSFPSRKLRTCLSQNVPFAQCRVGLRLGLAYLKHFLCHTAVTSSQMLGKQPISAYIVPHTEYSCKAHREHQTVKGSRTGGTTPLFGFLMRFPRCWIGKACKYRLFRMFRSMDATITPSCIAFERHIFSCCRKINSFRYLGHGIY